MSKYSADLGRVIEDMSSRSMQADIYIYTEILANGQLAICSQAVPKDQRSRQEDGQTKVQKTITLVCVRANAIY